MKKTGICLLLSALLAFSVTPGCALGGVRTAGEDIASRPESGLSLPAEEGTEDVNHPAAGWHQEEGKWYLLSDGERLTGWQTVDGKRYYLDETGVMLDGWQQIDGSWYLFAGGAMQTGWKLSGGNWYYFSDTGVMQTGWLDQGGRRYYLTASGAMKRGLITEGETVYTLGDSGAVSGSKPLSSLPNQSYGWGQGVQVDGLNRPVGATSYQNKFGQYDAYFIGPNTKTIYLTFDEGYENGYTASILDTLKEKGVQATFFITGDYLEKEPELVRRMVDEGHTVGNHTVNHPNLVNSSISTRKEELMGLHNQMLEQFDYTMTLLRPPEGVFSEQVLAGAQGLGYKTVFWSYAYKDWDPNSQMAVSTAYQKAVSALHPGAIYLLHAVSSTNAAMLGYLIDEIRAEGYSFGVLS